VFPRHRLVVNIQPQSSESLPITSGHFEGPAWVSLTPACEATRLCKSGMCCTPTEFSFEEALGLSYFFPHRLTTPMKSKIMDNFWDCVGRDASKRNWDQLDTIPVNEQSESETKRQRLESTWTTQGLLIPDAYPSTPSSMPMSQFDDPELSLRPESIWAGFQDENPISNLELRDIFTLEKEQPPTGLALDLVEQGSDTFLQIPEAPGFGQFLPKPDSGFDDPDVHTEKISTTDAHPRNELFTPQSLPTEPYDVCFGMVSGSFHL
jgi:hypothetical protein